MWDAAVSRNSSDLVCYVFHHWSGQDVDKSEVVMTDAACTPVPHEEESGDGLPAWYLFRSIPRRLCPRAGDCGQCPYVLGQLTRQEDVSLKTAVPQRPRHGGFNLSA